MLLLFSKRVFLVVFEAEVLEKPKAQIGVLKELYNRLAEVLRDCPAQYYRLAPETF